MTGPRWIDIHAPAVELKALTWGPPDGPIALFAPGGVGAGDAQPVGQRRGQLAAQLYLAGLPGQLVDQVVADGWQAAGLAFEALQ